MEAKKLEQLKNLRKYDRFEMKANLSEYLKVESSGEPVGCISTDLSKLGLGIVTFKNISGDTDYVLQFRGLKTTVKMQLMWCRADQVKKEIFHAGLSLKDDGGNLLEMFIKEGLLRKKVPVSDNVKGQVALDYYDFREVVSKLNMSDRGLVRKVGLKHLYDSHTAYQCLYKNSSLVIIFPRDFKPDRLQSMSAYDAAQKMMVVQEKAAGLTKSWVKIWPSYGLIDESIQSEIKGDSVKDEMESAQATKIVADEDDDDAEIDLT